MILAQGHHFFRRIGFLEQQPGRFVDADIGGLGGQGYRDQQGVGIGVVQLGLGIGSVLGQSRHQVVRLLATEAARGALGRLLLRFGRECGHGDRYIAQTRDVIPELALGAAGPAP